MKRTIILNFLLCGGIIGASIGISEGSIIGALISGLCIGFYNEIINNKL